MKILVIDDEPLMLASLADAFAHANIEAQCFDKAEAGLNSAKTGNFDVIILDIWMPGIDGLAIIKELRMSNPAQRIIVMTGGGPALSIETVTAIAEIWGAERVFVKPFDETMMIKAIRADEK